MKHTIITNSRNDHPALSSVKTLENRSPRRSPGELPSTGKLPQNDRTDIRPKTVYAGGQESVELLDLKDVPSISDKIDKLGRTEIFGMAYQTPNRENMFALLAS